MSDTKNDKGYPVGSGAAEKLDYLNKQVCRTELKSGALSGNGEPVWVLCGDGSLRFANAVIGTKAAK